MGSAPQKLYSILSIEQSFYLIKFLAKYGVRGRCGGCNSLKDIKILKLHLI